MYDDATNTGNNPINIDSPQCMNHNDQLDEIMNDVAPDFVDIPENFKNVCTR
jgi:hypothetical protein